MPGEECVWWLLHPESKDTLKVGPPYLTPREEQVQHTQRVGPNIVELADMVMLQTKVVQQHEYVLLTYFS